MITELLWSQGAWMLVQLIVKLRTSSASGLFSLLNSSHCKVL